MVWRSSIGIGHTNKVMSSPVSNGIGDHLWYHPSIYPVHSGSLSLAIHG